MSLRDDVIGISQFANIRIPPEEIEKFVKGFADILSYMDKIGSSEVAEVKVDGIIKHHTPLRTDKFDSGTRECSIQPERKYYRVPKVIK